MVSQKGFFMIVFRKFVFLIGSLFLLSSLSFGMACTPGEGTATWTIWGEEFIEQEIPAKDSKGDVIVEDGWTIRFTKFLVVIGSVQMLSTAGDKGPSEAKQKLFDLHKTGPHTILEFKAPAGTWDAPGYSILPATVATENGNAEATDFERMKKEGHSIYIEGEAEKAGQKKAFVWGFKLHLAFSKCKTNAVLSAGGKTTMQITIHADHLFYDDLENPEAKIRFDAIAAADKDNDGKVTLQELSAVSGAAFAGLKDYNVGRFSAVTDLGAFVSHLAGTIGHFDGEGECSPEVKK